MLTDYDDLDTLLDVLSNSHHAEYRFEAWNGEELTVSSVPVDDSGSLTFTAAGQIEAYGSAYVRRDAYLDPDTGRPTSLVPHEIDDALAPFGQELVISRVERAGTASWVIPMGRYRIVDVPDAAEYFRKHPDIDPALVGWEVSLKLQDRFDAIRAADFLQPEAPQSSSTYAEIQRLSPYPYAPTLADVTLPTTIAYPDSLYETLVLLADNLGGVPAFTRQGNLTVRKKEAYLTETVPVFDIKGVTELRGGMSNDVYNAVKSRSSAGGAEIVGIAQILDDLEINQLRVNGPLGRRTYNRSSPLITSQAIADADALTTLQRLISRRAQTCRIIMPPNGLLELGDWGVVRDYDRNRAVWGEVSDMQFSLDPFAPMSLDLIVSAVTDIDAEDATP